MKINCHNTFDRCKEVVLGSVDISLLDTIESKNKRFILEDVIYETKEDLDNIQKILESFDIKVHRPCTNNDFSCNIKTPFFETHGWHIPFTPRDIFFVYDDSLIITGPMEHNRYFEHHSYEKILQYYFDMGSHVSAMPFSSLNKHVYENTENDIDYFNNEFPMIAAANIMKYGKDIILSEHLSGNKKGSEWIKRHMGDEYRYHTLPKHLAGHVDGLINILKPGVLTSVVDKTLLPSFFDNWEVLGSTEVVDSRKNNKSCNFLISDNMQDDDFEGTFLGYNMFSIDQEHVLLNSFTDKSVLKQLEKNNIIPIFADIQHTHFLNQGHTCCILDTVRESNLEDYSL